MIEAVLGLATLAALSLALALCLKIKSSKKDPAFAGVEGTISPLAEGAKNGRIRQLDDVDAPEAAPPSAGDAAGSRPLVATPAASSSSVVPHHARTPSRGDRKLPDIPRVDNDGGGSDLYATLDGASDSDDDDGGVTAGARGPLIKKNSHPYAKVKKKQGVEHPYATVKKPGSAGNGQAVTDRSATGAVSSTSSSSSENGDGADDRFLLAPSTRSSRPGSNRSSRHNVDQNLSRQATPLPPEPCHAPPPPPPPPADAHHQQNPHQHFSGDSQDSSKGYTSITVREPVRHIHLQRPMMQDATYATVSETSDDMYAAIEDPTYAPGGGATSQSNSDTYAIIDLPEEASEVDLAPDGGGEARRSGPLSSPEKHTYSKVNKRSKRAGPLPDPSSAAPPPPRSVVRRSLDALGLEDMYAKVNKRGALGEDLELPMGASAMNPSASTGARPKVRSSLQWVQQHQQQRQEGSQRSRAEINYSDFEVSHYDKDGLRDNQKGGATYATVPEKGDGGYEVLQEERKRVRYDAFYETVPGSRVSEEGSAGGYESVPDYWRTAVNNNSNGGYETVTDAVGRGGNAGVGGRDPGYEVVRDRREMRDEDVGYETIPGPSSAAANARGAAKQNNNSEYDPNYEVLAGKTSSSSKQGSEPGYETVREKTLLRLGDNDGGGGGAPGYETVSSAAVNSVIVSSTSSVPPPLGSRPAAASPSVVRIERLDVSDVDETASDSSAKRNQIYV